MLLSDTNETDVLEDAKAFRELLTIELVPLERISLTKPPAGTMDTWRERTCQAHEQDETMAASL
jgi:hypothetical protein